MRLKKIEKEKICEVEGCKEKADFTIATKGIFKKEFCFCEECLKKMFKGYLGTSVPKPIESPFKPYSKIKKEERWKNKYQK